MLFFLCFSSLSANGKSVTWAQNERGYRPNLWKRISVHIKKKEEVNQTAIIKPFSKGGDAPPNTGVRVEYEEPQRAQPGVQQRYPPTGTYRSCSPSPMALPTVSQRVGGPRGCLVGEDDEEVRVLPQYLSERSQRGGCGVVSRMGGVSGGVNVCNMGGVGGVGVGDIGMGVGAIGNQPQGSTIMDQISCVVNRFTANISELNNMMLPGSPPGGATMSPSAGPTSLPPGPGPTPCSPPYVLPRGRQLPTTVTTYAEVAAVTTSCGNRPMGVAYDRVGGVCGSSRVSPASLMDSTTGNSGPSVVRTTELEELAALTPPSPFRDSSLGSTSGSPPSLSPASESALCEPCEAKYDRLVLRHYSQSSSSL